MKRNYEIMYTWDKVDYEVYMYARFNTTVHFMSQYYYLIIMCTYKKVIQTQVKSIACSIYFSTGLIQAHLNVL